MTEAGTMGSEKDPRPVVGSRVCACTYESMYTHTPAHIHPT